MAETELTKKPQRNALRSQKLIKKAFAKLLHEKDLGKITVSDIVKEAEICRGTFYAHYADINDLFEQMEKETIQKIVSFIERNGAICLIENPRPTLDAGIAIVEKDKEFYRNLLLNKSAYMVTEKLVSILRERFVEELAIAYPTRTKEAAKAFLVFVTNGAQGMLTRWLDEQSPLSTNAMLDFVCDMVEGCREAFIGEVE